MTSGFLRINREFLIDGQTLLIAGLRDDEGRVVKTRTRVLPSDCDPETLLEAYQAAFGATKVESLEIPDELVQNASRMWRDVRVTKKDP